MIFLYIGRMRNQCVGAQNAVEPPTPSALFVAAIIAASLLTAEGAIAQSIDVASPAFEVASIKPSPGEERSTPIGPISPDRFVRRGVSLVQLLVYAYDVEGFQIQSGDSWTRDSKFHIEAKADGRPTEEQRRAMLRRMLAERFSLIAHVETRELPRYALIKARADGRLGEKLRPSPVDCRAMTSATNDDTLRARSESGDRWLCAKIILRGNPGSGSVTLTTHGYPISDFARNLRARAGRVVVDRTGLIGSYDIDLETEMPFIPGLTPEGLPPTPREGLSLFTALQEQLGLKLESEQGPVDVLVIDRAKQPAPD
jgi:uncharacterized protein (TIGR03435 family)